ncbi:MAG: DUF1036 domain-containing protein [Caulobacterales bacterium]
MPALSALLRHWRTLTAIAAFCAAAALSPQPAHAARQGWVVCNSTSYILQAAVARPQGGKQISEGWIRLRPGECRQAVAAPLNKGNYLLFAQSSPAHRGGRQIWGGDRQLCVDARPRFSQENPKDCAAMGLEQKQARLVQVNDKDNWTTWLMEADIGSLSAARAAGVTRLLEDSGYESRRADGTIRQRAGPQMLAQFLADARMSKSATHAQVVDQLENYAKRQRQNSGLKICNRAKAKAWTAVAQRKSDGWETRGWWSLAPGGCTKVINDTLYQPVYYVHATLESPTGDRQITAANAPFCVGTSRFVISGQENCEGRYYATGQFFAVAPQGRPGLTLDLPESSFGPPPARRALSRAAAMAAAAAQETTAAPRTPDLAATAPAPSAAQAAPASDAADAPLPSIPKPAAGQKAPHPSTFAPRAASSRFPANPAPAPATPAAKPAPETPTTTSPAQ